MNIKPGNYSAHAYDFLRKNTRRFKYGELDLGNVNYLRELLHKGVKFLGPQYGDPLTMLTGKHQSETHEFIRMPFPVMCYELPIKNNKETNVDKCILIGEEVKDVGGSYVPADSDPDGFFLYSVFHHYDNFGWHPDVMASYYHYEHLSIRGWHFLPKLLKDRYDHSEEAILHAQQQDIMAIFCDLLALLNCKNLSTSTIRPPDKLNKSRIRKGKLPLHEYKVLDIHKDAIIAGESLKTFGEKNRYHMCRGHFKKLKTGLFWWNAHARGRKELGEIEKDYKV